MAKFSSLKISSQSARTWVIFACLSLAFSGCQVLSNAPQLTPLVTAVGTPPALSPGQAQTQMAIHSTATALPTATDWPIATPTNQIEQTPTKIVPLSPLTGVPILEEEILLQRPVLVKLANWPRDLRPSNQIINADIVFEYYNGHQTNHLLALFYTSDASAVGPLAPGRLVDARLARHYRADLVVASAPTIVEGVFENTLPDRVFYRGFTPCPGICTETQEQGGNTVVDTAAIREIAIEDRGSRSAPRYPELSFSRFPFSWDEDATRFSCLYADFSVMDWRYDPISGKYQLWQEVEDEKGDLRLALSYDRDSGQPIAFENLVFAFANYIEYNTSTYDINLREGDPNQQALFLRDGKMIFGTWYSPSETEPFAFFANGQAYSFKPGKTWITFTSTVSQPVRIQEGEWDLEFKLR